MKEDFPKIPKQLMRQMWEIVKERRPKDPAVLNRIKKINVFELYKNFKKGKIPEAKDYAAPVFKATDKHLSLLFNEKACILQAKNPMKCEEGETRKGGRIPLQMDVTDLSKIMVKNAEKNPKDFFVGFHTHPYMLDTIPSKNDFSSYLHTANEMPNQKKFLYCIGSSTRKIQRISCFQLNPKFWKQNPVLSNYAGNYLITQFNSIASKLTKWKNIDKNNQYIHAFGVRDPVKKNDVHWITIISEDLLEGNEIMAFKEFKSILISKRFKKRIRGEKT